MDALREYLENLFLGVTDTPEVYRAKAELLQMMEDKYDELIAEGKSEDEAVGKVISEFGNFDEIVKELGIEDAVQTHTDTYTPSDDNKSTMGNNRTNENHSVPPQGNYREFFHWTYIDTKNYILYAQRHAALIAIGVMMCILSTYTASITDDIFSFFGYHVIADAMSSLLFFLCAAIGVVLFILAGRLSKPYKHLDKNAIEPGRDSTELLNKKNESATGRTIAFAVGIIMCIMAPAISCLGDIFSGLLAEILANSLLLFVAVGVGMIIYSCSVNKQYKKLSKAVTRYYSCPELGGSVAAGRWLYQPKLSVPTAVIVITVIIASIGMGTVYALIYGIRRYSAVTNRMPIITGEKSGDDDEVITVNGDGEESFDGTSIDKIIMDVSVGQLIIEPVDGNELICEYHGEFAKGLKFKNTDKVLTIDYQGFKLLQDSAGMIKLRIPKEHYVNYDMDIAAGDVQIHNMYADEFDLDMAAGSLYIADSDITGNANIDLAVGNAEFTNTSVRDMDIECAAGDFAYHFADKNLLQRYDYDLSAGLGKISLAGKTSGGELEQSSTGEKEGTIEVEAAIGTITID